MISSPPHALFLHSFTPTALSDTLSASALQGLSQRALLLATSEDIVCCDTTPDDDYLTYLAGFGIVAKSIIVPIPAQKAESSLAERLSLDTDLLRTLRQDEKRQLEPYMATTTEWQLAKKLGYSLNGTEPAYLAYLNQKTSLDQVLAESNLPYLPSIHCDSQHLEASARQAHQHYGKLVIRASLGLGSQNVWLAEDEKTIKQIHTTIVTAAYPHDRQYVITPFIANTLALNAQFLLHPRTITFLGLSQQHIDKNLHYTGNSNLTIPFPLQHQVLAQVNQLADHLQQQGYRGYIGFDVIVNEKEIFIIEINPRVNTSTFALVGVKRIMGTLENTCFASASLSLPTPLRTFHDFETCLQHLLLRPHGKRGILPIRSPIANKSTDIIAVAPTSAEISTLLKRAEHVCRAMVNG